MVVDIGAHTGDWTVYCAKALKVMDIHAFEPLNENIFGPIRLFRQTVVKMLNYMT